MSEINCPHCGNDLTGETGLGIVIDVSSTVRYSAVAKEDEHMVWAEGSQSSAQHLGNAVRTLCGKCYEEVDAVPVLDGQEI